MTAKARAWTRPAWWTVLSVTVVLSVFGRPLQGWARENLGGGWIAVVIAVAGVLVIVGVVARLRKEGVRIPPGPGALVAAGLVAVPWLLPLPEERLHVVLFSLLGFLSVLEFGPARGLLVGVALAAADEGLQAFVPDRVADWRDVGFNAASAVVGAWAARWAVIPVVLCCMLLTAAPAQAEDAVIQPVPTPTPMAEPEPTPTPCVGKFSCTPPTDPLEVAKGILVEAGSRKSFVFELVASYGGRPVSIPVTVIRGAREGPTLLLTASIHGDELNGLPALLRVAQEVDPVTLNGTVILLPVVNPFGFERLTRYLPDRRDLNRYFPGNARGSLANRISSRIFESFVKPADYCVDFHTASGGRANAPHVRADPALPDARRLAQGFGGMVVLHQSGEGTLRHAANAAGVPTVVYEAGEAGRLSETAVDRAVDGIRNLLQNLGMQAGEERSGGPPLWLTYDSWVRSEVGGVVEMVVELGELVQADQLLFTVRDTLGGKVTKVRTERPGIVMSIARTPVTQPGNALARLALIGGTPTSDEPPEEGEEDVPE